MYTVFYTKTDEAPLFATYSLLPIFRTFCKDFNVNFESKDLSLSGRILASFGLSNDDLKFLGELTKDENANIIKLPNISASLVQLKDAIKELQSQGYDIPNYIDNPTNEKETDIKDKYAKVLGSAVNPVLREGNSDRRAPSSIKNYAKKYPHYMGDWSKDSKTHVSSMKDGDFYSSEQSYEFKKNDNYKIVFTKSNNEVKILKDNIKADKGDIIDGSFMSIKKLKEFYANEIEKTKKEDTLFSLHLKATMMKISDPVMFGAAVEIFYKELFDKYSELFESLNINSNNGFGDLLEKISALPQDKQNEILKEIKEIYGKRPDIAMVDSDKGVTNLHIPNSIIVDASMPAMIKNGGKMYDKNGDLKDTNALIPDRSYAAIYQAVIDDCKINGKLDVTTAGSVSNVGLMAKKAEEYGSHDKTFILEDGGIISVKDENDNTIFSFNVEKGDIFRVCQTKDIAIKDWVKLAYSRAKITQLPTIFWLDPNRAHDRALINKIDEYLKEYDTSRVDISILNPKEATEFSLKRMREGKDTISVTGNVARDYLTDLFPIMELGTSAKMLSIVPLMNGGGLFETGAGGSAPALIQRMLKNNRLTWDSFGEFMAVFASLEFIAEKNSDKNIALLATTLDKAIENVLINDKTPKRNVGELDTRGSHFYLAYYWAKELHLQKENSDISRKFEAVYKEFKNKEQDILNELNEVQGKAIIDVDGYFNPSDKSLNTIMRPSKSLNSILDNLQ